MRLLSTGGYLVVSDLGLALGPDRLRAKYGLAQALDYPEVAELLEEAQDIQELVRRVHRRIEEEDRAGGDHQAPPRPRG